MEGALALRIVYSSINKFEGCPGGSVVKTLPANVGDPGSVPGWGRSPGEGNGNPHQYLAWETPWIGELGGLQSTGSQNSQT